MKKLLFLLFTLCFPSYPKHSFKPNGFCSAPVADLLGAPIKSFFNVSSVHQAYKKLPYGDKRGHFGCPRIAQLIFNEPVEILEKKGDEIKVRIPHITYPVNNKWHDTYWTLADNITPLTSKIKKAIPSKKNSFITLKKSLYNPQTKVIYPVGTKFVKTHKRKSGQKYSVHFYNPVTQGLAIAHIPQTSCLEIQKQNKHKQQKCYVQLCKEWAHPKTGFIPYVFGGSSIGLPLQQDSFITKEVAFTPRKATFYERSRQPQQLCTGIDCARLFTRAAQMSGIPLYATNTKALKSTLTSLKKNESIEQGDLVLWTGHVFMISDIKKGLLVEARSYDDGYGKVHEIPYHEQLKEIQTTQDLINAHFSKKRLTRLNRQGKKSQFIYDLEILKFSSLWKNLKA